MICFWTIALFLAFRLHLEVRKTAVEHFLVFVAKQKNRTGRLQELLLSAMFSCIFSQFFFCNVISLFPGKKSTRASFFEERVVQSNEASLLEQ